VLVSLIAVAILGLSIEDSQAIAGVMIASAVIVCFLILETYRRHRAAVDSHVENLLSQFEAIIDLRYLIKPIAPLPPSRGWAASPDFLRLVAETIFKSSPRLVVEASSGLSTIVIGYCLKSLGQGRVISLEHNQEYAKATQELLSLHGLSEVAEVVHAPLTQVSLAGEERPWYDISKLHTVCQIDLLVVDGPPQTTQHMARYPAMPIMHEKLSDAATVLLDDGARLDEAETARRWVSEFADLEASYIALEKGAFVFRKLVNPRIL
jgi:hypothetical protein